MDAPKRVWIQGHSGIGVYIEREHPSYAGPYIRADICEALADALYNEIETLKRIGYRPGDSTIDALVSYREATK